MAPVSNMATSDELKVYRDEGEGEDEERSSAENLKEVKNSLVIEVTEEEENRKKLAPTERFLRTKDPRTDTLHAVPGPGHRLEQYLRLGGYMMTPYPSHNVPYGSLPMMNRVPLVPPNHHPPSSLSMLMYNVDQFQPPPAHMGISPMHMDPKTGIPRPPVYPLTAPSQFHSPVFPPEFPSQYPWGPGAMYSMGGFRPPSYPPLSMSPASLPAMHASSAHHPLLASGPKIEIPDSQDSRSPVQPPHASVSPTPRARNEKKNKSHIKKPLNAFMLFMKEQRPQVVAECTLKESAAINQILGKRWHDLSRDQQAKYYDMAREERHIHQQKYPGWTARDNYAINAKKKKRKRDKSLDGDGNNPKKCRARFGLDQQSSWCKPCRRKKKCIRYRSGSDNGTGEMEENIGSVDSLGSLEAPTPDSRYSADGNNSDSDSGNVEDDAASSELSSSSPSVPRPMESVQSSLTENGHQPESPGHVGLPQLPTPPSTDSSLTAAPLLGIT